MSKKLEKQIEELKKRIEELEKALRFYADGDNVKVGSYDDYSNESFVRYIDSSDDYDIYYFIENGETARNILAKESE